MADRDYEVGYGKPPQSTRFAPGKSGNPSGKRKAKPTLSERLDRILAETISVTESGRTRKLPKEEVFLRQLVNKAVTGERHAGSAMLGYLRERQVAGDANRTWETDAYLLEELRRMYPDAEDEA